MSRRSKSVNLIVNIAKLHNLINLYTKATRQEKEKQTILESGLHTLIQY